MNLKGKSLLTLKDYTKDEILFLLDLSTQLKNEKKNGIYHKRLANKNFALIFEKASTRTRSSFSVAASDEGASSDYFGSGETHFGKKESVEDSARVLGRMYDGIAYRGYAQDTVEKLAKYSGVPVWNGLTDDDHPTQALADLLTIKEHFGRIDGIKIVYVGDGRNNVANALVIAASKMGIEIGIISPKSLYPTEELVRYANEQNAKSGGNLFVTDDIISGAAGADVVYTDVWISMGEEEKAEERISLLQPYQVNAKLMSATKNENAVFLHCLPAVKGKEVTEEVFESKYSLVFDEAENRMHTIKAVMVASLCLL